jgi:catechol 2,3-dioxygenase-like lactoylglutathione lyase family enzyme
VVFDHVGIAVSAIGASERFYRTVLSVLGVERSHADAELVEWDGWAIGPTDSEHPVTRGLHVGLRARDRAQVDAFSRAGVDAGVPRRRRPGAAPAVRPDVLRRVPARSGQIPSIHEYAFRPWVAQRGACRIHDVPSSTPIQGSALNEATRPYATKHTGTTRRQYDGFVGV